MRIILILSILICFGANAQTTPSVNIVPTIYFGSAKSGESCSRTITMLSYRDTNGLVISGFSILRVKMYLVTNAKIQKAPLTSNGPILSAEMQTALRKTDAAKEVLFMTTVRSADSSMTQIIGTFNID